MTRFIRLLPLVVAVVVLLAARAAQTPQPLARYVIGGGPTIVLIHGLGSRADYWLPVGRALASKFRVTLVDLPGHGINSMPRPFSLEQARLALDRTLREDGDHSVILVGHSLGGLVAAAEAITAPERVRGLVLVETSLRPQVDADRLPPMLDALEYDYRRLVHAAYLGFGRDSAQGEKVFSDAMAHDPKVVKQWIRLAWTSDLSREASSIRVPVLAVLSDRSWPADEPWNVTANALGYKGIARLDKARLSGGGHFVMLDHPKELAGLIASFAAQPEGELIAAR